MTSCALAWTVRPATRTAVVVDNGFNFPGPCGAFHAAGGDPFVRNARLLDNQSKAEGPG